MRMRLILPLPIITVILNFISARSQFCLSVSLLSPRLTPPQFNSFPLSSPWCRVLPRCCWHQKLHTAVDRGGCRKVERGGVARNRWKTTVAKQKGETIPRQSFVHLLFLNWFLSASFNPISFFHSKFVHVIFSPSSLQIVQNWSQSLSSLNEI